MLLIGQYDSPFVRRVAVALKLYGIDYEHAPWSGFADVALIAQHNPLRRVPTLVDDDGKAYVDSAMILELIDHLAGPARAFLDRGWPERGEMLRLAAFAAGAADKAVALVYENAMREQQHALWVRRCRTQVNETLALLEQECARRTTPWLFGDMMSHADVMIGTMLRFLADALPGTFDLGRLPALAAHGAACEALTVFEDPYQPFKLTQE